MENQFSTLGGAQRCSSTICILPLTFFCTILDDVEKENAAAKLLILLDKAAPSLLELFSDLVESREMGEPLANIK